MPGHRVQLPVRDRLLPEPQAREGVAQPRPALVEGPTDGRALPEDVSLSLAGTVAGVGCLLQKGLRCLSVRGWSRGPRGGGLPSKVTSARAALISDEDPCFEYGAATDFRGHEPLLRGMRVDKAPTKAGAASDGMARNRSAPDLRLPISSMGGDRIQLCTTHRIDIAYAGVGHTDLHCVVQCLLQSTDPPAHCQASSAPPRLRGRRLASLRRRSAVGRRSEFARSCVIKPSASQTPQCGWSRGGPEPCAWV